MRFLAVYIMRGRMQAIMVVATVGLLSMLMQPLTVISMAGVALVTLRQGIKEGFWVLLIAAVVTAILGNFLIANTQFAFVYGLFLWLPIWLVAIVLRVTGSMGTTLETAVFLGILTVIGFYTMTNAPAQFWLEILNLKLEPLLANAPDDVPVDEIKLSIERVSHFMTGMIAAGSVFGVFLSLMLGRWWQSQLFNPGGFGREFITIKTSPKFALGTVFIIIVAVFAGGSVSELACNISIPLVVLYTFIGTAIIHVMLAARKNAKVMIPIFYGTMFILCIMSPLTIMPVAFAGLADTWLNLRAKISNKTNR